MSSGYKLFLLSLFPCCCIAQADAGWEGKALYKDHLYVNRLLQDSHNPVSISDAPEEVADFEVRYASEQGDYKPIDRGRHETLWTGNIYGIRKIDRLSFEGGIEYANRMQADKKWSNALFIAGGNPFFIADSIAGDQGTEQFTLSGGLSYVVTSRWRAALRAVYLVGTLADQTDPRPLTQGMRFYLNPGLDYRFSPSFTLGISAGTARLSESTTYTVVNSIEPKVGTIFLFKGLGSPETKSAIGYKRRYEGNQYMGHIQLVWNASHTLSNLAELGFFTASEDAKDGDTGFDFKGGDYRTTTYMLTDRFQLKTLAFIHNLTLRAEHLQSNGIWYLQTQSTDTDGNTLWTIRDKSVTHRETALKASLHYRIDHLKGAYPRLTSSVRVAFTHSGIRQYPDLYSRKYSLLTFDGDITRRLHVGKGLLTLSLRATYAVSPLQSLVAEGSKLYASYLEPAFQATGSSHYACGADVVWQTPLSLVSYPFLLSLHAGAAVRSYNDQATLYSGARRQSFNTGLSLIF
ncbi:MAG: hypothetical protein LBS05_06040 [Tannerellaceae bacterium]|jgi:hypothetical protein|nr:hypothetical protein [Tannerellaceae bacterium]